MLQSYVPNRTFTLVRNPNYNNQIPTMPSGAPDKVVGKIVTDPVASYQQVVSGQSDYDYNQVPNDRLPEAQSKYKDQLRIYTNANTWYYFLNNKIPPFNNLKARQAVNYAIDRQAIVSGPFGGLGRPTENFLVDAAVPESGRLLMFGTGLLALGHLLRRRTALSDALSTSA